MSSTGTKRSRNLGTASTSRNQMSKKNTKSSTHKSEKISKYFAKVPKSEDSENSEELSDSPYKNWVSDVQSVKLDNSASELDDFKTPKAINKVSKIVNSKPAPKNTQKRKKSSQPPLRKFVEDNFKHTDVNPDHLQMALALSESSYEAENPNAVISSQEKLASFKEALEKYGFGYAKSKISVQVKKEISESKKRKSRYRYVTPILKIRTEEERQSLISSKVSLILAQNSRNTRDYVAPQCEEIFCESLKQLRTFKVFKVNCSDLDELNEVDRFYVSGLGIGRSPASCGTLLKDWRKIPGRELTPERENIVASDVGNAPPNNFMMECRENAPLEDFVILTPPRGVTGSETHIFPLLSVLSSSETKLNESLTSNSYFTKHNNEKVEEKHDAMCSFFQETSNDSKKQVFYSARNSFVSLSFVRDNKEESEHRNTPNFRLSPEINSPVLGESPPTNKTPLKNSVTSMSEERISLSPTLNKISSPVNHRENSPRQGTKRSFDCVSPDLFESDDDQPPPILNRLRGGVSKSINMDEIECYDLTQSDSDEEKEKMECVPKEKSYHIRLSELGDSIDRRSDLNVTDYVEDLLSNYKEKKIEKISTSEEEESQQSQSSVLISDDELNYSSVFGTPHPKKKVDYELSDDEDFCFLTEVPLAERIKQKTKTEENITNSDETLPYNYDNEHFALGDPFDLNIVDRDNFSSKTSHQGEEKKSPPDDYEVIPPSTADKTPNSSRHQPETNSTPNLEDSFNNVLNQIPLNDTPNTSNASFYIKTKNVTPMANYEEMDTPKIVKELDRFGLKPLKRQKGAKLLRYIYESTHPVVADENQVGKKKRETLFQSGDIIVGEIGETGDIIFERKQSKRIASCAVPLHIVWHNFVMSNPKIRENILLYEPLQLEVLHSMLKDQGFKFNIQDLLTFLDKKCVTIRTAQGQHHGARKPK